MGLDGKAEKGVQEVKEKIHKRTGTNSTRFGQKNKNRSIYIRLYNRKSIIYRI